jgi:hypothetical protein
MVFFLFGESRAVAGVGRLCDNPSFNGKPINGKPKAPAESGAKRRRLRLAVKQAPAVVTKR